ncbi:MAG: hypothetical protein LH702_37310 [Phormidesmis sp. CAN_BIN44]|nr:hypothetical protein [Phormidesmis sp. CAN_BIN44]
MHIPSAEIYKEIFHEPAGIWFVPALGTDTHAILLKAPTNVLKAVMAGCEVKISFAIDQSADLPVLISCVQIYDDKDTPVMVFSPHIKEVEHKALPEILNRKSTPLFLYDELSRNIAWAESAWSQDTDKVSQLILSFQSLHSGEATEVVQFALDNLQVSLDPAIIIPSATQISFDQIGLVSQSFNAIDILSYSVNDKAHIFNALSKDEGGGFEQSAWQLLESLFDYQLYKSPQTINNAGKERELTDLFAFNDKRTFLFEAKVSSVLNTSSERSTERRTKNIESQIKKALGQLYGAMRAIRSEQKIVSKSSIELNFDRKIVPHSIVVISEMFPAVNWTEITKALMETALESSSMVHIIDLVELRNLIGYSSNVYYFDYYLMQRFEAVINKESAFVRTKFIK